MKKKKNETNITDMENRTELNMSKNESRKN